VSTHPSSHPSLSSPWPLTARWAADGLEVGGLRAADLAPEFGTPLLLLDVAHVEQRARELRSAFPCVHYAVKALTCRRLLRLVDSEGLRLLAASRGELEACLRAGVAPGRLALHGNNKSAAELDRAIAAGIGLVIVDNADEIARAATIAARLGRPQDVLVRVIPGITAGGHRFIETGADESKFGLPIASGEAEAAVLAVVESRSLSFRGLHAHIGSQILTAEPYLLTVDRLSALAGRLARRHGIDVELLDTGGGLGITYRDEEPPAVGLLAQAIASRLRAACRREGIPVPGLVCEPGRAVVGGAGITLYRVGCVKERPGGVRLLAVDGGMSDNPRPMLYGAAYEVTPAAGRNGAPSVPTTVVGPHCESGDVLAEGLSLPANLVAGDLLAVAGTGAYCYSLSSNYNRTPRPALVAVKDGEAELWLRAETYEDLERLEVEGTPCTEEVLSPGV